jgi:hypothetical protein
MPQFEAILKDIHTGHRTLNIFHVLSDKPPKKLVKLLGDGKLEILTQRCYYTASR